VQGYDAQDIVNTYLI